MATLALTTVEIVEVRSLLGNEITTDNLTDAQITSGVISGEASDYVFEKVRESLNIDALGATEKAIALRIRDDADDDIAAFVNTVLKEPQARFFRRAIVYRSAGNATAIYIRRYLTTLDDFTQRVDMPKWTDLQTHLYKIADEQIARINKIFPSVSALQKRRRYFAIR